jgi:hypothetical protein
MKLVFGYPSGLSVLQGEKVGLFETVAQLRKTTTPSHFCNPDHYVFVPGFRPKWVLPKGIA